MNLLTTITVSLVALVFCARLTLGDGNFKCDGFTCPKNTYSCSANARDDPNDSKQIIRERKCLSEDGKVLQQQVVKEPNPSGGTGNSYSFSFGSGGGHGLTSEEARKMLGPPYMPSSYGGYWFPGNMNQEI